MDPKHPQSASLPVDPETGDRSTAERGPRPRLAAVLRPRLDLVALVSLGGAAGALARWGVDTSLPHGAASPAWSTLLVNTTGALLIGVLTEALARVRPGSRRLRPLVGTGVLGGYTTFSAAVLDVHGHLLDGRPGVAAASAALGLMCPLVAAAAGMLLARSVVRGRQP